MLCVHVCVLAAPACLGRGLWWRMEGTTSNSWALGPFPAPPGGSLGTHRLPGNSRCPHGAALPDLQQPHERHFGSPGGKQTGRPARAGPGTRDGGAPSPRGTSLAMGGPLPAGQERSHSFHLDTDVGGCHWGPFSQSPSCPVRPLWPLGSPAPRGSRKELRPLESGGLAVSGIDSWPLSASSLGLCSKSSSYSGVFSGHLKLERHWKRDMTVFHDRRSIPGIKI